MTICYPDETDWSCHGSTAEIDALDPDKKERSEMLAWYTLAALTGYRIGVCPTTIRPCSARCASGGTWMEAAVDGGHASALPLRTIGLGFTPHIVGGNWVNGCGHRSASDCSCNGSLDSVVLPGPVGAIESVKLDGEVVSPAFYRVDSGRLLVNLDPDNPWPSCVPANATDDEGLIVTYYQGMAPNEITKYAAGILASEFYKACTGGKCRLPRGATEVVRNGTTVQIQTGLFQNGDTGIPEVNAVIRILNPNGLKVPNKVLSPDAPSGRAGTWRTF